MPQDLGRRTYTGLVRSGDDEAGPETALECELHRKLEIAQRLAQYGDLKAAFRHFAETAFEYRQRQQLHLELAVWQSAATTLEDPRAYAQAARVSTKLGRKADALSSLESAIRLFRARGDTEKLSAALKHLLHLEPRRASRRAELGLLSLDRGEALRGRALLSQARTLYQNKGDARAAAAIQRFLDHVFGAEPAHAPLPALHAPSGLRLVPETMTEFVRMRTQFGLTQEDLRPFLPKQDDAE